MTAASSLGKSRRLSGIDTGTISAICSRIRWAALAEHEGDKEGGYRKLPAFLMLKEQEVESQCDKAFARLRKYSMWKHLGYGGAAMAYGPTPRQRGSFA